MQVQTETQQFSLGLGECTKHLEVAPHDDATLAYVYAEVHGVFPLAPPCLGLQVFVDRIDSGGRILINRTSLLMLRVRRATASHAMRGALVAGDANISPTLTLVFRITNESAHPVCGAIVFAFIHRPVRTRLGLGNDAQGLSNFDRRPR